LIAAQKKEKTPVTEQDFREIGLRRRDNGEFPAEIFDPAYGLALVPVIDGIIDYFRHPEMKSGRPYGHSELPMRRLIVKRKV
jgi:hypothetical protein